MVVCVHTVYRLGKLAGIARVVMKTTIRILTLCQVT